VASPHSQAPGTHPHRLPRAPRRVIAPSSATPVSSHPGRARYSQNGAVALWETVPTSLRSRFAQTEKAALHGLVEGGLVWFHLKTGRLSC
jgi:hypothetical protein